MRPLTADEQQTVERRRAQLRQMQDEVRPRVIELAEFVTRASPDIATALGYDRPERAADEPEVFLPALDAWLADEDLADADREALTWLHVRLMYVIVAYLGRVHGGVWEVEDDPASPLFAQLVVRRWGDDTPAEVAIAPATVAHAILT